MLEDGNFAKAVLADPEELAKETAKYKKEAERKTADEIMELARKTLIDDDDDEIGKRLCDNLEKLLDKIIDEE